MLSCEWDEEKVWDERGEVGECMRMGRRNWKKGGG